MEHAKNSVRICLIEAKTWERRNLPFPNFSKIGCAIAHPCAVGSSAPDLYKKYINVKKKGENFEVK